MTERPVGGDFLLPVCQFAGENDTGAHRVCALSRRSISNKNRRKSPSFQLFAPVSVANRLFGGKKGDVLSYSVASRQSNSIV